MIALTAALLAALALSAFLTAAEVALFSIGVSTVVGPRRFNRAKLEAYECGIEPSPQPPGGGRFPVKFYLVAMLFLIFDVEVVFLYPWAIHFRSLGLLGLAEMGVFLSIVVIGFIYAWKRGALDWN